MAGKMHQNRTVVIGRNVQDAHAYARGIADKLEEPVVVVSAAAHALCVSGSVAGMHIAEIHVTGTAPEAEKYDEVFATVKRAGLKNPDLKVVQAKRVVQK